MVKFRGFDCDILIKKDSGGRPSIHLICNDEQIAKATVNVPDISLPVSGVLIRSYGANNGIAEALVEAKVIKLTGVQWRYGQNFVDEGVIL